LRADEQVLLAGPVSHALQWLDTHVAKPSSLSL
jgi:hypothetical protein